MSEFAPENPGMERKTDAVGIVVAMKHEFAAIKQVIMPEAQEHERFGSQVALGKKDGVTYVLVQAGIGTTNAALGACDLIHWYRPCCLFNLGTTALIHDEQGQMRVGDVVAGEAHYQWDLDINGPITAEWTHRRSYVDVLDMRVLRPDKQLLQQLGKVAQDSPRWVHGTQYTGNSFFSSDEQHNLLPKGEDVVAVDMESFAVAQVCARKGIPFISLRGITDIGSSSANDDFYQNVAIASRNAAELAHQLALALPAKL